MAAPLAGVYIVDAVTGPMASITRYLADLGARVERIVPREPESARDLVANAGKHPKEAATAALDGAHAVVADLDRLEWLSGLRVDNPSLVTMAVSDFGYGNEFSRWQATGKVLHALSGVLSRSGLRGRPPLMPPLDLPHECAAVQAAFVVATLLYRAMTTGQGGHVDFSGLEGAVQTLDPGYGINGSATLGRPVGLLSRDRPSAAFQYPILPCEDGYVRICLLSKRQWQGMFEWMGRPERFAGPEFDKMMHRYKSPDLLPAIGAFFIGKTRRRLEAEGQAHGVPISGLNSITEFITSDHVEARRAFEIRQLGDHHVLLPTGVHTIDGERACGAIASDTDTPTIGSLPITDEPLRENLAPLAGLRVLDLGVIVVGAEQARLLADLGADVVKIESRAFPDGNRQSYLDFGMSVSFAAGHRNKRSLGIDLRSARGRALFLRLVAEADVLCANFKPGTLERLGLGHDVLREVNPALVVSESSAFGDTGPWSDRMGYGPLVRAAAGLTKEWRYAGDPQGFCDAVTVYPDHVAARACALGAVALLIRRLRSGEGGRSAVAQSEVMLAHLAGRLARSEEAAEEHGPSGVFAAKGYDEWCVVDVVSEVQAEALAVLTGGVGEDALRAWLADRAPQLAAEELQSAGIPAAPMLRIADLPEHPFYRHRKFYRTETHPWMVETVIADSGVARSDDLPAPGRGPAPLAGEQTAEIVSEWLGLSNSEISDLCAAGVLEPLDDETRTAAQAHLANPETSN